MKTSVLEVKEDGKIYVVKDCPEKPVFDFPATPDSSDYEIADEQRQEYEKALASCERILVSDQEVAHGIIWRKYASPKDRQHGNELKPGLYQVPVEWEKDDRRLPHYPVVAILKEQQSKDIDVTQLKEESQEELWKDMFWNTVALYSGGGIPWDEMMKRLNERFTITRNKQ